MELIDSSNLSIPVVNLSDERRAFLYPAPNTGALEKVSADIDPALVFGEEGEQALQLPRICHSCAMCHRTTYQRKQEPTTGRCGHVAFYKAGIGQVMEAGTDQTTGLPTYEHKPFGQLTRHYADVDYVQTYKGEPPAYYFDIIDIKLTASFVRGCRNWTNPIFYAQQMMVEDGVQYNSLPGTPAPHIDLAMQYFTQQGAIPHIEGLQVSGLGCAQPKADPLWEHNIVADPALEAGGSCSLCRFYEPALDKNGVSLPMRGTCTKATSGGEGLFSMLDTVAEVKTFAWYACTDFTLDKAMQKRFQTKQYKDLPLRMQHYLAINPIPNPRVEGSLKFLNYQRFSPLINAVPQINIKQHEYLLARNLDNLVVERFRNTDLTQMSKDMQVDYVFAHFNMGLNHGTKAIRQMVKGFKFYRDSDSLFGEEEGEKVPFYEVDKNGFIKDQRVSILGPEYEELKDLTSKFRRGVDPDSVEGTDFK